MLIASLEKNTKNAMQSRVRIKLGLPKLRAAADIVEDNGRDGDDDRTGHTPPKRVTAGRTLIRPGRSASQCRSLRGICREPLCSSPDGAPFRQHDDQGGFHRDEHEKEEHDEGNDVEGKGDKGGPEPGRGSPPSRPGWHP
jgi:hypothetical protein